MYLINTNFMLIAYHCVKRDINPSNANNMTIIITSARMLKFIKMRALVISVTDVLLSDSNVIEYCVITNPFMHMNKN